MEPPPAATFVPSWERKTKHCLRTHFSVKSHYWDVCEAEEISDLLVGRGVKDEVLLLAFLFLTRISSSPPYEPDMQNSSNENITGERD